MTNAYLEKANSPVLSVLSLRNFSLSLSLCLSAFFSISYTPSIPSLYKLLIFLGVNWSLQSQVFTFCRSPRGFSRNSRLTELKGNLYAYTACFLM